MRAWTLTAIILCNLIALHGADRRAVILERAAKLSQFPGQIIPQATPELIQQAEEIAKGTVFFYDRTPVKVGLKKIDWSGSQLQHQEWPAQLNRFQYLNALAAAFKATGQERFAQAARAYIEDWLHGSASATGVTLHKHDSTLNMSIRLGSSADSGWGGTLPAFLSSPAFDDKFLEEVFASMSNQANFLANHLTPQGNWRISELDALVFTALRFPFLENAPEALEAGVTGMRNALATEFTADGVHVERAPEYASWMTLVLANYFQAERLFPQVKVGVNAGLLGRALDYAAQSELFGVNDSTAPHRDPENLPGLQLRAQTLRRLRLDLPEYPALDQAFPVAGQVFVRTGWKPGSAYLAFDASKWGGGHSHLSRLSFAFRSGGQMLVADPGILNYEMSDPLAPYGKSTPAHSTLNLGGLNQSGADAQLMRTEFTSEFALIQARYQGGYWPGVYKWDFENGRGSGVWGDHERVLFWVKGEYILVLDNMNADAGADVRNVWQLGPMEKWSQDPASFSWWSENEDTNLFLQLVVPPAKTVMKTYEGSREPLRGWVGFHGDDAVPAPLVEFRYPAEKSNVGSAVLLTPFLGHLKPRYCVKTYYETAAGNIRHLELKLADGSTDMVVWTNELALPVDDGRPFVTDATFVWQRADAGGRIVKHFLLTGHGGAPSRN
jgi:hypothetical protein